MTTENVVLRRTPASAYERLFDRYLGGLLGAAIADALGWITEFSKSKAELERRGIKRLEDYIEWSKPTGGRFHTYLDWISKGEYSDDTQLTLCTVRSLRADGTFDEERFVEELRGWLDYSRGAGAAITAAARHLRENHRVRWNCNFYGTQGRGRRRGYFQAGGNGAAMRVAPHALANPRDSRRTFVESWKNALVTHGHPRALLGAVTMAEAVRVVAERDKPLPPQTYVDHLFEFVAAASVPNEPSIAKWEADWERATDTSFHDAFESTKREMTSMLRLASNLALPFPQLLTQLGCFAPATKGSGTGCVVAAIAAKMRWPDNFPTGVLEIVNTIGIDTDTIASMYGSLVGVTIGSTKIPDRWSVKMQDYEYFISAADVLSRIALKRAKENELRVDVPMIRQRESADIVELTRGRAVNKNQRVVHKLLGPGWVRAVHDQEIRSGGRMLLVDVVLDSGQSVKFKSGAPSSKSAARRVAEPPASFQTHQPSLFK